MQRANIHPFSLQNTLRTSPAFASNQKISFWTALAVNAPDGPSIREIGIAWTAVSSNASTVQECQSWEARNNSFCPYCRKLYLPPERVSKHACAPTHSPLGAVLSYGLGVVHLHCFHRVSKCSAAFSPLTASFEISLPIYRCACAEAARTIFQPSWVRP